MVRAHIKKVYDLRRDADIEFKPVATEQDVRLFEEEHGPGPSALQPLLAMYSSISSDWNQAVCRNLLRLLNKNPTRRSKIRFASDDLVFDTLQRKCTTL